MSAIILCELKNGLHLPTDGRSLKLQYARFEIENGLLTNYLRFD